MNTSKQCYKNWVLIAFLLVFSSIIQSQTVVRHHYDTLCQGTHGQYNYPDTLLYETFDNGLTSCWTSIAGIGNNGIEAAEIMYLRGGTTNYFLPFEGMKSAFESDADLGRDIKSLLITPSIHIVDPAHTTISFQFIVPATRFMSITDQTDIYGNEYHDTVITDVYDECALAYAYNNSGSYYPSYLWHINYDGDHLVNYNNWTAVTKSLNNTPSGAIHYVFIHNDEGSAGFGLDNVLIYGTRTVVIPSVVTEAVAGSDITTADTVSNASGCTEVIIHHWHIQPQNIDTISATACDSYTWRTSTLTYTTSGLYHTTMRNQYGCDSIERLNLTILSSTTADTMTATCDSMLWDITGITYHASGHYPDTTTNAVGCDSITTLHLTINHHSTPTIFNANTCGTYLWSSNGTEYNTSGDYYDTLTNIYGCDSILHLNLTLTICPPQVLPDNVDTPYCTAPPPENAFEMRERYVVPNANTYTTPMVADIDGDGMPEILACATQDASLPYYNGAAGNKILVIDGASGTLRNTINVATYTVSGQLMSIADVDGDHRAEFFLLAEDRHLHCYDPISGTELWVSTDEIDLRYMVMTADINNDGRAEVVCGPYVFDAITGTLLLHGTTETTGRGYGAPHTSSGHGRVYYLYALADMDFDGTLEMCAGNTIYKYTLTNTAGTAGNSFNILRQAETNSEIRGLDGQTFMADFDNDGDADVCVIGFETGNKTNVYVWDGQTSNLIGYYIVSMSGAYDGSMTPSIPFAGDLDGDGTAEIIFNHPDAMRTFTYDVTQPHNIRLMHYATRFGETAGFTVFDFNQDGREEILYRNTSEMYIVDGTTLEDLCSPVRTYSTTICEYAIIADIDADGHADIVVCRALNGGSAGTGELAVYSSRVANTWGSARTVWNQWAYNSVNINEDLSVPQYQFDIATTFPNRKKPFNGFLRQMPHLDQHGDIYTTVADLYIDSIGIDHDDIGATLTIDYCNQGDNSLEAPYSIAIYLGQYHGTLYNTIQIETALAAGSCNSVQMFVNKYMLCHADLDSLVISVNDAGAGAAQMGGQAAECDTTNNQKAIELQHIDCDVLLPDNIDNPLCVTPPPANAFEMVELYSCEGVIAQSTPMVGDVDGDGIPEVLGCAFLTNNIWGNKILVFDGRNGTVKYTLEVPQYTTGGQLMSLCDANRDGQAELYLLSDDGYLYSYSATGWGQIWRSAERINDRYLVMSADVNGDGRAEIVCGPYIFDALTGTLLLHGTQQTTARGYAAPHTNSGEGRAYYMQALADIDHDGMLEFCVGNTIYKPVINNFRGTAGNTWSILRQANTRGVVGCLDGQTFSVDFDNDGDEDVCVVGFCGGNHTNLYVWDGQTDSIMAWADVWMSGAYNGTMSVSIPFAGDLDGNGTPEIIFNHPDAMRAFTFDTSSPTNMRLMHQSSRFGETAGFTVFDFNQDGREEIIYRDIRQMFIVDGTTLDDLCSPITTYSGTVAEYTLVADANGDGHANIVVCHAYNDWWASGYNANGKISVFASRRQGSWGSARKVWNQWAYNSVCINEDLTVPIHQFDVSTTFPNGKKPFNGFLRQMPRLDRNGDIYLTAPDLAIVVDSTKMTYSDQGLDIKIHYCNQGENLLYNHSITLYKGHYRGEVIKTDTVAFSMNYDTCITMHMFIPMSQLCWIDNDTMVIAINDNGMGVAQNGGQQSECDTTNNLQYLKHRIFVPKADTLRVFTCDSYRWQAVGQDYDSSAVQSDTISDIYGCDSVRWLELTIYYKDSASFVDTICDNFTYPFAGRQLTTTGHYDTLLRTTHNCDSTLHLALTVITTYNWNVVDSIDSYDLPYIASNGVPYTYDVRNEIIHYTTRIFNCDSNEHLYLTVLYHVLHCNETLQFPNLVTPNGDGINDNFCIIGLDNDCWPHNELIIYNRWGKQIYQAEDLTGDTNCWDTSNTPSDTYYFHFRAHSPRGSIERSGVVEVIQD